MKTFFAFYNQFNLHWNWQLIRKLAPSTHFSGWIFILFPRVFSIKIGKIKKMNDSASIKTFQHDKFLNNLINFPQLLWCDGIFCCRIKNICFLFRIKSEYPQLSVNVTKKSNKLGMISMLIQLFTDVLLINFDWYFWWW